MLSKQIPNSATGDAQERTAGQPVEEAHHEHGSHVVRERARDREDEEEGEARNIDGAAAVELPITQPTVSIDRTHSSPTTGLLFFC